jgi:hypothetical protein
LIADPVNLATQSARFRVFNGKKWYLAQDFSWLKGQHLWQFGGSGYIAHDFFVKSDNFAGGLTAGRIHGKRQRRVHGGSFRRRTENLPSSRRHRRLPEEF